MFRVSLNRSSFFYRLIKPTNGGTLKQYLTVPIGSIGFPRSHDESGPNEYICVPRDDHNEPFTMVNSDHMIGLDGSWTNDKTLTSCEILEPGMILLKNYISLLGQVDIFNICEKAGPNFYKPTNRYGTKLRFYMMSFGRNWDPVYGYNNSCRGDGSEPPWLPIGLVRMAKTAIESAHAHLDPDELPLMCPDTCVVKYLDPASYDRIGLHQDIDESLASLKSGLPVVSICIGNTVEFWYGYTRDANKLRKVLLESGDVLIYGGKSRLIFHGVKTILKPLVPHPLFLATRIHGGWLNLTLRQF